MPRHRRDIANDLVKDVAEEITLDDNGGDAARRLVFKLAIDKKAVVIERVFVFLSSPRRRLANHPAADALIVYLVDPLPFSLRTSRALGVGLFALDPLALDPLDGVPGATCRTSGSLLRTSHDATKEGRRQRVRGDGGIQVVSVIRRYLRLSYIAYPVFGSLTDGNRRRPFDWLSRQRVDKVDE